MHSRICESLNYILCENLIKTINKFLIANGKRMGKYQVFSLAFRTYLF